MIPELGHFALLLAWCVAGIQGVLPLVGAQRHLPRWIALARPATAATFGWYICLLTFSVIMLPFFLVMLVHSGDPAAKLKDMMDWAKTVLPPVIGFASALVGYLFGMRTAQPNAEAQRPRAARRSRRKLA